MAKKARVIPSAGYGVFGKPDPDKRELLRFFREARYDAAAAGTIKDEVTGEYTDETEVATMRDGFVWGNKDAYHFERYDMELTPEFRAYALRSIRVQ